MSRIPCVIVLSIAASLPACSSSSPGEGSPEARTDPPSVAPDSEEQRSSEKPAESANAPEATEPGPMGLPRPESMGLIERLDPRMDELVPPGNGLEKLAKGFDWSEGPVWVREGGYILLSDIPRNAVYRWKEGEGLSEYLKPSGYTGSTPRKGEPGSNGLLIDSEGRLVLCQHGDRCIARIEADGTRTILVDRYEGRRLNSPNDAVYHSNGDLYFTDPPYGLEARNEDPTKELDFNGVFLLRKSGELVLLTRDMTFPNGIALSPNETTLYVANSDGRRPIWMAFDLKSDGTLEEGRVFFSAKSLAANRVGGCDGMKIDRDGNIFATGPGGVLVLSPDGTHLGTLLTGVPTANCAWGDDGSVLYVTADMFLCRIRLATRGLGW